MTRHLAWSSPVSALVGPRSRWCPGRPLLTVLLRASSRVRRADGCTTRNTTAHIRPECDRGVRGRGSILRSRLRSRAGRRRRLLARWVVSVDGPWRSGGACPAGPWRPLVDVHAGGLQPGSTSKDGVDFCPRKSDRSCRHGCSVASVQDLWRRFLVIA
jgi:hypothetical protein